MTKNPSEKLSLEDLLNGALQKLSSDSPSEKELSQASQELSQFAEIANEAARIELYRGAEMLSRILELATNWSSHFPDDPQLAEELVSFVNQKLPVLQNANSPDSDEQGEVDSFIRLAEEKWSEYFELIDDQGFQADPWGEGPDEADDEEGTREGEDELEERAGPSESQIEMLLSAVSDANANSPTPQENSDSVEGLESERDDGVSELGPSLDFGAEASKIDLAHDRELLEAYLDDAVRCLGSMENAALSIESSPEDKESVQQFCRELHTLKGASATVGLSALAAYLHDLESSLQEVFTQETACLEVEKLFDGVDRVREEIEKLQPSSTPIDFPDQATNNSNVEEPSPGKPGFSNFASNDGSSIRIRASKLDRLMDMLAELVVLRNRRESHVADFNLFNEELARCALRLKFAEEQPRMGLETDQATYIRDLDSRFGSSTFSEVGKDIAAVSHGLQELQKPVFQDNASISRFIRDFRQELMQLRRVPVSGLFSRLQRAARDAAKSENKQVQIKLIGEQAGLEQEIQERLFESLLHIVRNSVSHGIESEEERIRKRKDPTGVVILEAFSSAQLLVIEVRDDGNGIDFAAVRNRAIEKRLLSPSQYANNEELANLIFHPGFSTRELASEVSGRGVGMDIVAKTIAQLHGRIEVDSETGVGTTIRLSIPLRTGIEHVMVFRSDGQLFALPMQSVTAAKSSNAKIGNIAKLSLSSAFSLNGSSKSGPEDVLLLRRANYGRDSRNRSVDSRTQFALAVDEMVGPEEVVVRGLPSLLKRHPLFCGVTLSGSGETVLLLDCERVVQFCHQHQNNSPNEAENTVSRNGEQPLSKKRALVVDDSLTARKVLVKLLNQHDVTTVEAGDGIDAIERLHREQFDIVFTDLDMPRLGGLELLSDIQSGRYCDAPVVVISSRDEEAFRTRALDYGAIDYLTKPVSEKTITQLLEQLQLLPATSIG